MRKAFRCIINFILIFGFITLSWADPSFVVQKIDVQGLQHIQLNTVEHYLPIKVGDTYTTEKGDEIIAALYKTGFFNNVSLAQQRQTLIIKVIEEATIGYIQF